MYPSTNLNLLFRYFRLLMEYIISFKLSEDEFQPVFSVSKSFRVDFQILSF